MPRTRSYDGKVVAISGAAGGIGRALALAFGRAGASLLLLDLQRDGVEALAKQLSSQGIPTRAVVCDVCDPASCEAAMELATEVFGGVDVIIANAGISHRSLFAETDPEVLRRVMEVNFFGAVNLTRAGLASVRERRGQLIAVSSVAGFAPLVGRTGYAASKHALHGFFDSLRSELSGTGVDVLVVCPAFTDTALATNALAGDGHLVGERGRNTAGGTMRPVDVAEAVLTAAQKRRRLAPISPIARGSLWLSRLAPRLYERAMLKEQGSEFARSDSRAADN
jgi:NAD(P)-dependent dehydrogenase (short-subunit alcohol dehydrogenase family)